MDSSDVIFTLQMKTEKEYQIMEKIIRAIETDESNDPLMGTFKPKKMTYEVYTCWGCWDIDSTIHYIWYIDYVLKFLEEAKDNQYIKEFLHNLTFKVEGSVSATYMSQGFEFERINGETLVKIKGVYDFTIELDDINYKEFKKRESDFEVDTDINEDEFNDLRKKKITLYFPVREMNDLNVSYYKELRVLSVNPIDKYDYLTKSSEDEKFREDLKKKIDLGIFDFVLK